MAANNTGLLIEAERLRKSVHSVTIGEADGEDASVAPDDNVRLKVGRAGEAPLLEIESAEATPAGSSCTAANPTTVTLAAADLSFPPGIYDCEIVIIDRSESEVAKAPSRGVFILKESFLGAVTID